MRRRILDVNAYTTLDFVDARAVGTDWETGATAVVDVDVPDDPERDTVRVSVELDGSDVECLPRHVDRLNLPPEQARALAEALLDSAEAAE